MGSRSVADLLQASGPLSARDAARIGADVCLLLEGLHTSVGPLGAISAGTVMLLPGHKVSLAESAAPRGLDQMDPALARFAAPEILEEEQPSRAADIYSVGALIYHMLTGTYPVDGDTTGAMQEAHRSGAAKPLSKTRVGLPKDLVAAVERAMASDPTARFADAASMKATLLAAVSPRTRATAPPSLSLRVQKPLLFWSLAAGTAAVILAGAVLVPRWLRAGTPGTAGAPALDGPLPVAVPVVRLTDAQRQALGSLAAEGRRMETYGAYGAARRVYDEALRIGEAAVGPESPQLASAVEDEAFACLATGDYTCAQSLYDQALMLREKSRGVDQTLRARTLLGMALLKEEGGDDAAAARLREEAARMPGWNAADLQAPYRIDVTLLRLSGGGSDRMAADSFLDPGDKLGLQLSVSRDVSLYVIDEESEGVAYLLYPLPAYESRNPLRAHESLRLPGRVLGRDRHWLMAGALEGERLLMVVSPVPLQEIEDEVRALPAASYDGKPILASRLSDSSLAKLRSVAGQTDQAGRLFPRAARPGTRSHPARGIWIRAVGNDARSR